MFQRSARIIDKVDSDSFLIDTILRYLWTRQSFGRRSDSRVIKDVVT